MTREINAPKVLTMTRRLIPGTDLKLLVISQNYDWKRKTSVQKGHRY